MVRTLTIALLVAVIVLGGMVWHIKAVEAEKNFDFEKEASPVQKADAEKVWFSFRTEMTEHSIIEWKDGTICLVILDLRDKRRVMVVQHITQEPFEKECTGLYDASKISRIVSPRDRDYPGELVKFIEQK
jgi:hypothetical protein